LSGGGRSASSTALADRYSRLISIGGDMVFALLLAVAISAPPVIDVAPAPDETIGDWTISPLGNGAAIASTSNSAGARFGTICDKAGCVAFFNPSIKCENGHSYPALVNAPAAAFSVTMQCEKVGDLLIYDIPMEGGITEAMSVGGVIGFALPMASGEFKVARFSLTGAARAAARAQQLTRPSAPSGKTPAGDNYSL